MTKEMKMKYNKMVEMFHKGCDFLDNPKVAEEKKKKWKADKFDRLMADMNMIAKEFKLSEKEMLEGFEI